MKKMLACLASLSVVAVGCGALGPSGGLYTGVKGPRSFQTGGASNAGSAAIAGESCAMSILGLVALGDWSVDGALKAAGAEGKTLKNVAVDTRVMSILGFVYGTYCTAINAQIAEGAPPAAEVPVEEVKAEEPKMSERVENGRKLTTGFVATGATDGMEEQLVQFIEDGSRPVDKTTWFNFDRINFRSGSAELEMAKSKEQLTNIAEILKAYPAVKLKVGGYTDNSGKAAANKKLSQQRAEAVAKALEDLGVEPGRLDPEGYGSEHPICPANNTPDCKAKNRRLAVRVTEK
ncbi:OmpA family protein [Myxococcota bacterium]|nr:OmpA family protein [Myxococcota bacterium]